MSGMDCPLVMAHCIGVATLDASYLRSHECHAVFEILGAVLRPHFELVVVGYQSREMLRLFIRRCKIPICRVRKRAIINKLRQVKMCR